MRRRTRQLLWMAVPILLITLAGLGTLLAAAGAGATVFLPLVVRAPALEEPAESLPHEIRLAVIEDVTQFIADLPHEDFEAETHDILARLGSHPEIESAVADDTGDMIWAVFTDGVTWYIFEEPYVPLEGEATLAPAGSPADSPGGGGRSGTVTGAANWMLLPASESLSPAASGAPAGIPVSDAYRLLNALGGVHDRTNPIPQIQAMFDSAGYTGIVGDASVQELRSGGGEGVLYLRAHGLAANKERGRPSALSTSTLYTAEAPCALTAGDLAYGRLALMSATHRRWQSFLGRPDTVYAINHRFITYYWDGFDEDSLVYIDACTSITFDDILAALRAKNVSIVMGWNGRVRPATAQDTSRFVFDRLLGANVFRPENPPQRAFDYGSVFARHIGPGRGYGYCSAEGSTLVAAPLNGGFGLLAPSIKRMEIKEEPEELIIHGLFGEDPGAHHRQVTVQGEPLPVDTWTEHRIKVAGFTPDKEGEVLVTLNQRESNKVPITSWRQWEIRATADQTPWVQDGRGCSIIEPPVVELVWKLDIRADVHSYRDTPGTEPIRSQIPFYQAARSSTFSWQHTGVYDTPEDVAIKFRYEIEGEGTLDWHDLEEIDHGYWGYDVPEGVFGAAGSIRVDTETKHITLCAPYHRPGAVETQICLVEIGDICGPGDIFSQTQLPSKEGGCCLLGSETWDLFFRREIEFDGYDIPAGDDERHEYYRDIHTLTWQAAQARHVPRSDMKH